MAPSQHQLLGDLFDGMAACRSLTFIETCRKKVAQMTVIETYRMEAVQCRRERDAGRDACRASGCDAWGVKTRRMKTPRRGVGDAPGG